MSLGRISRSSMIRHLCPAGERREDFLMVVPLTVASVDKAGGTLCNRPYADRRGREPMEVTRLAALPDAAPGLR